MNIQEFFADPTVQSIIGLVGASLVTIGLTYIKNKIAAFTSGNSKLLQDVKSITGASEFQIKQYLDGRVDALETRLLEALKNEAVLSDIIASSALGARRLSSADKVLLIEKVQRLKNRPQVVQRMVETIESAAAPVQTLTVVPVVKPSKLPPIAPEEVTRSML